MTGESTGDASSEAITSAPRPWWFRSNYKPVTEEIDSHDLPFEGNIPEDLNGLLLRNGPNPDASPTNHWLPAKVCCMAFGCKKAKSNGTATDVSTPRWLGPTDSPKPTSIF